MFQLTFARLGAYCGGQKNLLMEKDGIFRTFSKQIADK